MSLAKIMNLPIKPNSEDCCNSGCNPCIFDVYEKQLKLYEKNKDISNKSTLCLLSENGISQIEYRKFYLLDVVQLNNLHKILMFKKIKERQSKEVWWNPGDHFLIKYTSPSKMCTRAYTPIMVPLQNHGSEDFDFYIVVKKYLNGLVSNYLFNLNLEEETIWRGPYGSYKVETNKYSRIIMIAQGTGVAPFISIIQNILSNEEDITRIILYYCSKRIEELLFREELYEFHSYWNFIYKIFLSNARDENCKDIKYEEPIEYRKFNIKELQYLKPLLNVQYLLCGSVEFMKEYETRLKNDNYSDNIILF